MLLCIHSVIVYEHSPPSYPQIASTFFELLVGFSMNENGVYTKPSEKHSNDVPWTNLLNTNLGLKCNANRTFIK